MNTIRGARCLQRLNSSRQSIITLLPRRAPAALVAPLSRPHLPTLSPINSSHLRHLSSTPHRALSSPHPTNPSTPSAESPESPEAPQIKLYTYATLKPLTTSPSPNTILIDVREPSEFSAGHIPTAKNLPIITRPDALFLPEDEFLDAFGWEKPGVDREVVFYCKAGIRSRAAARMAWEGGWRGVGEYGGSWVDWVENEKEGN